MEEVINITNLSKSFKKQKAIDCVSFAIKRGEICGLVGKNGAGKTTLMKMMSGLIQPTGGKITVLGSDISKNYKVLQRVGILIEEPGLLKNCTAYENMKMKFIQIGKKDYSKIDELLRFVELDNVGKKKAKNFSYGMKQRLGIALALASDPQILILDEPINGLDPEGIASFREMIVKINRQKNITILISSHVLEEMAKIASNYLIVDGGKIIANMTKSQLESKCKSSVVVNVDNIKKTCKIFNNLKITNYNIVNENTIEIYDKVDKNVINKELVYSDVNVYDISTKKSSLEEFYFEMVGGNKKCQIV